MGLSKASKSPQKSSKRPKTVPVKVNLLDGSQYETGVEEHLDRALALRDDLPLAFYLLGRWSYQVATLSWLERKAAAALYDRPPTASTQEALELFMKAERLNPGFSKMVRLHIAKCHKELGNGLECRTWTRLAASATPDDDPESRTLEKELLAETDPPTGDTLQG
ncbi:hypothetical protein CRUP_029668 [Coryphaenoides rupestris]|nr:hypothetical protein CRUP_029668 [Coryphaenoides rupestris]